MSAVCVSHWLPRWTYLHFLGSQSYGTLDDTPGLDNADDACHGYTTDTDALGVVFEDFFRSMAPTVAVISGFHWFSTESPQIMDIPG